MWQGGQAAGATGYASDMALELLPVGFGRGGQYRFLADAPGWDLSLLAGATQNRAATSRISSTPRHAGFSVPLRLRASVPLCLCEYKKRGPTFVLPRDDRTSEAHRHTRRTNYRHERTGLPAIQPRKADIKLIEPGDGDGDMQCQYDLPGGG